MDLQFYATPCPIFCNVVMCYSEISYLIHFFPLSFSNYYKVKNSNTPYIYIKNKNKNTMQFVTT